MIQPKLTSAIRKTGLLQFCMSLFFSAFSYGHYSDAQSILDKLVWVSADKAELKDVFLNIRNQTGARFVYSSKTVESSRKVTIKASNKKLSEVLDELLLPLGISYKIVKDRILLYRPQTAGAAPEDAE